MGKKIIFLFLALLLPALIFVFLKIFGKNQFAVEPLFQTEAPSLPSYCDVAQAPYSIPLTKIEPFIRPGDSLSIVFFRADSSARSVQGKIYVQLADHYKNDPITLTILRTPDENFDVTFHCIFAMKEPKDIVLVDNHGLIRGQYESTDRDEIDRLKTEITIILKRY